MERIPRPETLVRRRSQRVSNGSNFEADFKMLQDSDDDCIVSNDSGMKKSEYFYLYDENLIILYKFTNSFSKIVYDNFLSLINFVRCKTLLMLVEQRSTDQSDNYVT